MIEQAAEYSCRPSHHSRESLKCVKAFLIQQALLTPLAQFENRIRVLESRRQRLAQASESKEATVKTYAGTKKGRTTKKSGVDVIERKPAKAKQQVAMVKRVPISPEDQNYVLNDLLIESQSADEQMSLGAIDRLGRMDDTRATACLVRCRGPEIHSPYLRCCSAW